MRMVVVYFLLLQVVGSRGSVEINPRDTMAKESSILGVALASATPVSTPLLV